VLRLNQQVIVGNWHLDYDNGFVVFCTRLAAPDSGVTGAMLRAVHLNNVAFVAKQVSAFNRVVEGTANPAEAAAHVLA
jgi:hypothetical protein